MEKELNLALGAMLRDYIALNAPEDRQRNFIEQSRKIIILFNQKKELKQMAALE